MFNAISARKVFDQGDESKIHEVTHLNALLRVPTVTSLVSMSS
jgi:hypothetical protein